MHFLISDTFTASLARLTIACADGPTCATKTTVDRVLAVGAIR